MSNEIKVGVAGPSTRGGVDAGAMSDEELMNRMAAGRHDALGTLFDRYHQLVFSVALRIVRDPGEAEEVVQTVFLDVFRAARNFDSRKGSVKVWLLQYAYHRALHRKRHLTANHFYRWQELEAAIEAGWSRQVSGKLPEVVRLAEQVLEKLKPRQRIVVEMTYYQGNTAEEIAERLNQSVHAVRHDLRRGLAALRVTLGVNHERH